jgi:predicted  nucleic acid-binding Zn-ribbon protein
MFRPTILASIFLLSSWTTAAQSPQTESQTLLSLLTEIRQLRQEVQTAALAARRTQVLIFRLHQQENALAHASAHLEEAKRDRDQVESQKKYYEGQIKRCEQMRDRSADPKERQQFADAAVAWRDQIDALSPYEQELLSKETRLTEELRIEQGRLEQLQTELDHLAEGPRR